MEERRSGKKMPANERQSYFSIGTRAFSSSIREDDSYVRRCRRNPIGTGGRVHEKKMLRVGRHVVGPTSAAVDARIVEQRGRRGGPKRWFRFNRDGHQSVVRPVEELSTVA